KDFYIMCTQSTSQESTMRFAGAGQQIDYEGDACTIDVLHIAEIEENDIRLTTLGFVIGIVESFLGAGIYLSMQIDDSDTWLMTQTQSAFSEMRTLRVTGLSS